MMALTYTLLGLLIVCAWLLHSEIKHSERLTDALLDVTADMTERGCLSARTTQRVLELAEEAIA